VAAPRSGFSRESALRCAMKLQQYSGPVMAKGLEDTAFYRYNRFIALNEVGGRPDEFGRSIAAFHYANRQRAERWPSSMLGTSTHDTKRGEDTRARLAVLSEMPEEWAVQVQNWSRVLRARRGDVEGTAPPERNDEYLLYQLLVGTWPVELLEEAGGEELAAYAERVKKAMVKSIREAKVKSTWAAPGFGYEEAVTSFVGDALDPSRSGAFLAGFLPFAGRIAELGARNTLVQTVLKLTVPGMPDFYQGSEVFDLSMVDPDNRRPVDYRRRMRMLDELLPQLAQARRETMRACADRWRDGRFKLAAIATLLDYRREHPELFGEGEYDGLKAEGPDAEQVCAFIRRRGEADLLLTVAARFPARRAAADLDPATLVPLPEPLHESGWADLLNGTRFAPGAALRACDLFAILPAAVLVPLREAKRTRR
jgi:(1->4)-alpha-D-glucan 1-alpha-D-glucosylmutase